MNCKHSSSKFFLVSTLIDHTNYHYYSFFNEDETIKEGTVQIGEQHFYRLYRGYTSGEIEGCRILHPKGSNATDSYPNSNWCVGSIDFTRWTLHSLEPLHVEPSILCICGSHGYIRNGKWIES